MVGWFVVILLSPLKTSRPMLAVAIEYVGAFAIAAALLAALSLLMHPSGSRSAA
jgi:hypothetical protein